MKYSNYNDMFTFIIKLLISKFYLALGEDYLHIEQPNSFRKTESSKFANVCQLLQVLYSVKWSPQTL